MIDRPELSLALHPLRPAGGARAAIEWAGTSGFRWVTLDGAAPGVRARELDRSSRRDLASLMRRSEIGLAGIDLWVPPAHFEDPRHADRAMAAVVGAIDLVAALTDLNGGVRTLSLVLPADLSPTSLGALVAEADDRSVRLADHAWPARPGLSESALGVGLDPAALLNAGENPAKVASRLGASVTVARLSDSSEFGRVEPGAGAGRLNDLAYAVALETAKYRDPVVLDTRGLGDPAGAAVRAAAWWRGR